MNLIANFSSFSPKNTSTAKYCNVFDRTTATAADASDVVEILRHSLYDTYSNDSDELVFERSLHGSGVSVRSKFKRLLGALVRVSASAVKFVKQLKWPSG